MAFFAPLKDRQVLELLSGDYTYSLPFDEFSKLKFSFHCANVDSHVVESVDPEQNTRTNIISDSVYYSQNDFDCMLHTGSLPMLLMYIVTSIPNNLDKFLINNGLLTSQNSINFMAFSETRLSDSTEHLYSIKGYKLFTNNRNHYGGGVCMFTKDNISCNIVTELSIMENDLESVP